MNQLHSIRVELLEASDRCFLLKDSMCILYHDFHLILTPLESQHTFAIENVFA